MKKLILVSLISSFVSAAAFAGPATAQGPEVGTSDSTSATLTWEAAVPVIIPGAWITFTGEGGSMKLKSGDLNVKADGSFASTDIKLELHTYDEATSTPGELLELGQDQFNGAQVDSITYSVTAPHFESQKGSIVKNIEPVVSMNNEQIATDTNVTKDDVQTSWSVSGTGITSMVGGDTITATTVVRADVEFAAVGGGEV